MAQSKEVHKEYMRKRRKGSQDEGSQDKGSQEMVPASYVEGRNGVMYEFLPERPRYLALFDGQLDRLNQPEGHLEPHLIEAMRACNDSSFDFKPRKA